MSLPTVGAWDFGNASDLAGVGLWDCGTVSLSLTPPAPLSPSVGVNTHVGVTGTRGGESERDPIPQSHSPTPEGALDYREEQVELGNHRCVSDGAWLFPAYGRARIDRCPGCGGETEDLFSLPDIRGSHFVVTACADRDLHRAEIERKRLRGKPERDPKLGTAKVPPKVPKGSDWNLLRAPAPRQPSLFEGEP